MAARLKLWLPALGLVGAAVAHRCGAPPFAVLVAAMLCWLAALVGCRRLSARVVLATAILIRLPFAGSPLLGETSPSLAPFRGARNERDSSHRVKFPHRRCDGVR